MHSARAVVLTNISADKLKCFQLLLVVCTLDIGVERDSNLQVLHLFPAVVEVLCVCCDVA